MTTTKSNREALVAEKMNEVREALSNADIEEAKGFYKVAVEVQKVDDEKDVTVYGERALERLAETLGQDCAELRRFAAVARRWPPKVFAELCRRLNANGMPLTWGHWLVLGPLEGWESWLERALAGSWSPEKLRSEVRRAT